MKQRIFDYEATGLEPEKIMGLCEMDKRSRMAQMLRWEEAEKDGRLVVLPCKVGDTVWIIRGRPYDLHPVDRTIREIDFAIFGGFIVTEYDQIPLVMFGKTVFLTREEAEAALRGEEQ